MADKYTIQIQPQIGASDALKMEQDLNRRFGNVAKKFGDHLRTAIKTSLKTAAITAGGAGLGLVGSAVFGNPIEKINQTMDNILMTADDIATRANQFGVTTEKFGQLASIAASMKIDPVMALQQLQQGLEEAKAFKAGDLTKSDALVNFLNEGDLVDTFYAFAREMEKLTGDLRSKEVSKIFGSKIESRIAELFQINLDQRRKEIYSRGVTPKKVARATDELAAKEDLQSKLAAQRFNDDLIAKNKATSFGSIRAQDQFLRSKQGRENSQLSQYQIFVKQAVIQERMAERLDEIKAELVEKIFPRLEKFFNDCEAVWNWFKDKLENVKNKGFLKTIREM